LGIAPLILLLDLRQFFFREIALDLQIFPHLLHRLALELAGDDLAGGIEESLDVEQFGGDDETVENLLVDRLELLLVIVGDVFD
ncbi:hypothetical protein PMAYCL1PPCAC_28666, partial [Pristionchus mayeri]